VLAVGQLLDAIADPVNLRQAWAKVRANAGAAGVDGVSVAAFEADAARQLMSLRRRLLSAERYVPPPVRRVEIPKPDGRKRPLGVPTVADRVVQQATVAVIGPFFEARFLPCSFGYRPGRSATQAVGWVREAIRRGDRWGSAASPGFSRSPRPPPPTLTSRPAVTLRSPAGEAEGEISARPWYCQTCSGETTITVMTAEQGKETVLEPLVALLFSHFDDLEGSLDDADHRHGWRFCDTPPGTIRRALALVDGWYGTSRPNGQPPAVWLAEQAEHLGGLLAGHVTPARGYIRVDAICVPAEKTHALATAVDQAWPPAADGTGALDLADAEAWDQWDASQAIWSGNGRDLLTIHPPGVVVGLWWD
jgi:hypothetical protein